MHIPPPRSPRVLGTSLWLLALWLQLLAPALTLRMAAFEADPLARPIICGQAAGTDRTEAGAQAPAPSRQASGHCDLCAGAPATPTVPVQSQAPRILTWQRLAWVMPPPASASTRPHRTGQPRAPPFPA